jgi:hypothetical protein
MGAGAVGAGEQRAEGTWARQKGLQGLQKAIIDAPGCPDRIGVLPREESA